MIGYCLHRTIQECCTSQDRNSASVFLSNAHLCMIWGVGPTLVKQESRDTQNILPSVTSHQLLYFLDELKLFSPLFPGTTLVVPALPHTLPRSCDPDSTSLTPRRSYILSYLPSFLHSHLTAQIVSAIIGETSATTSSPGHAPSSPDHTPLPTIPIVLSGNNYYDFPYALCMADL